MSQIAIHLRKIADQKEAEKVLTLVQSGFASVFSQQVGKDREFVVAGKSGQAFAVIGRKFRYMFEALEMRGVR